MSDIEDKWDYWFELDSEKNEWVQYSTTSNPVPNPYIKFINQSRTPVKQHPPTGTGVFTLPKGYYVVSFSFSSGISQGSKKHTFDDTKDWESYYASPVGPAPTPEDFHQLGHPPQCDCGAEKANTTHARWCSKGNL